MYWVWSVALAAALLAANTRVVSAATAAAVGNLAEGEEPTLDGVVDEAVWMSAEPHTGFVQQNPNEGEPASEKTEVRLLLGRTTLYVGIVAYDSDPSQILVTESRRDGDLNETDSIQLIFDTFNDNQNGFLFGTNPVGIEYDGQVAGEGQTGGTTSRQGTRGSQRGQVSGFNPNWDGDWLVRSSITERGWESEMAIPLKTLRYPAGSGKVWGFNVQRNIRRKNEQVYLSPIPRGYNIYRVSLASKLQDLEMPGRRDVKIIPFVAGRTDEDNLVASDPRSNDADIGIDVKWGVTPNLTADFTANTDFAQVEADNQQINLTRFPLFFPEKRGFFLENASTFQFGAPQEVDLFFSRRIGLGPGGIPTPILAGGRLSGRIGEWNIGVLEMQTQDAYVQRTDAPLSPAENFAVLRVQRQVGRSSYGGMFVNRANTSNDIDAVRDHSRNYGVDANVQLTENTKLFSYLAGSNAPGDGTDYSGRALVNYATNWWSGHFGYTQVGENFRADTGFLPRRGFRKPQGRFFLDYQPEKYPWIRRFSPHVTWNNYYGFDGEIQTSRGHYHFFEIQPQVGGRFGARYDYERDRPLADFTVFSGADGREVVIAPDLYGWGQWTVDYFGNPSALVSFDAAYHWGDFYGGTTKAFDLGLNFRIGGNLQASIDWNRDDIKLPGGDFTVDLIPVRVNYSFTPLTSISALVQYNSQMADVSSNVRFAWLNRSGTGLFVVYNDRRNTFDLRRIDQETMMEFPDLIGRSLIVKYTYLFDF